MRTLLVAAAFAGLGCLVATHGDAAPPAPRVVGISSSGEPRLTQLDARTLRPVHGGWSRALGGEYTSAALSPAGTRIAVGGSGPAFVLDSATGRVVRKYGASSRDIYGDLYWLGGDDPRAAAALIVAVGFGCSSSGCEYDITTLGSWRADGFTGDSQGPVAALRGGLVFEGGELYVFGRKGFDVTIPLRRFPRTAPSRFVADVAHDRLFLISSAGLVARIDHAARKPAISYHRVDLNGRPFEAAWAGAGKIALWGEDGLGTIDTRTWQTRAIAAGVQRALTTPFGIATWSAEPGDGLTLYRPNGTRRFQVLGGEAISSVQAVGEYLYVNTDNVRGYSVNLRTGEVVGPLNSSARIITPTLVSIP